MNTTSWFNIVISHLGFFTKLNRHIFRRVYNDLPGSEEQIQPVWNAILIFLSHPDANKTWMNTRILVESQCVDSVYEAHCLFVCESSHPCLTQGDTLTHLTQWWTMGGLPVNWSPTVNRSTSERSPQTHVHYTDHHIQIPIHAVHKTSHTTQ